jgi:hypothetical protein
MSDKKFKIQTIPITISSLIVSALNGIIGYIAVYFFKPAWEKLIKWWHK